MICHVIKLKKLSTPWNNINFLSCEFLFHSLKGPQNNDSMYAAARSSISSMVHVHQTMLSVEGHILIMVVFCYVCFNFICVCSFLETAGWNWCYMFHWNQLMVCLGLVLFNPPNRCACVIWDPWENNPFPLYKTSSQCITSSKNHTIYLLFTDSADKQNIPFQRRTPKAENFVICFCV